MRVMFQNSFCLYFKTYWSGALVGKKSADIQNTFFNTSANQGFYK